jgi:hypothetical protein
MNESSSDFRIVDEGLLYLLSAIEEGFSNKDISVDLLHFFCLRGIKEPLFYPRIKLGGGLSYWPDDSEIKILQPSTLLSVRIQRPDFEIERTFHFGKVTQPSIPDLYEEVRIAHEESLKKARNREAASESSTATQVLTSIESPSEQRMTVKTKSEKQNFLIQMTDTLIVDRREIRPASAFGRDLLVL